jgi:cytochrome c-type biogenesis protein CcmH
MTSFWVVAGIFIVGALLFILPTLLRSKSEQQSVERETTNISIYRDQISELDNDLRNDVLNQEQYNQSKYELQQRMMQDMSEENPIYGTQKANDRNIATSAVIILAIPILAVSLYLLLGNTQALIPQAAIEQATIAGQAEMPGGPGHPDLEIASMVDNLVARLEKQPDDLEGWLMLGRTYSIMGRFTEASEVYAKLLTLSPESPEVLVNYADVFAMTQDGSLMGKPIELINKALSIEPKNPKALALAGTAKFEQGNFEQAAVYWEELLALIPVDSKLAQSVTGSIERAKTLASNGGGMTISTAQSQNLDNVNTSSSKNQKIIKSVEEKTSIGTVSGVVKISPALTAKAAPEDTLYIYARAKEGPRMPLAIVRLQAKDLPAQFLLKDGMGMNPNMKLSSFPEVVISARVTKTGKAIPASGDLQGFSEVVKVGDQNVNILIDQQIP